MIKNQRVDEGRIEAEHGKLDYKDSSEDEEVKLLSHRKGADEPDPPGAEIRDVQAASDTQRDEWEDGQEISGVGPEGVAIPELGVTPLVDSGTDLEDELPTPGDSPSTGVVGSEEVVLPGARPAPPDVIDFELERALLQVSMLPMKVTPIVDPMVESLGTPSSYPAPPLPVLPMDEQIPVSHTSPLREGAGSPVLDVFPTYTMLPAGSVYGPATSPVSPSFWEDDVSRPPSEMAPMDQYLPRDSEVLLGESTDLPLLAMPLTPRPIVEEMVLGSAVGSPDGEPIVTLYVVCRTCPERAPLMFIRKL